MKFTSYAAGTPCWVDLATPDVEAALGFYGKLFGWTGEPGPPETGGYVLAQLGGETVAGIGPMMSPDQPSVWTTYFASDNAAATVGRVEKAGGKVLVSPMEILDLGTMAIFMDTGGAVFGVWQKGTFAGAGVASEPGALTWTELMTRDVAGAKAFYAGALGLGARTSEVTVAGAPYTEWTVDGREVAGMMSMDGPRWPADVPANWLVYFQVADIKAATGAVTKLGGSVSVPPTDIPIGTFAVVADPSEAHFALFQTKG